MTQVLMIAAATFVLGPTTQLAAARTLPPAVVAAPDTVQVSAPTGDTETDRANIQASFDAVRPGGTVQFAPGTYLLGAGARLTVPDVTVLGHPEGTVLRGCDPEEFEIEMSQVASVVFGCTGLYVQTERQTIRGLTFEYTWHGIVVGPYATTVEEATVLSGELPPAYPAGGQRIEANIFRATPNGLRVLGTGNEMSIVRDNDFIDVFHAIGIYGAPLHFLDNRVTVEKPERVPFTRHPGSAIIVSPFQTNCAGHVVAGNRIEGYPDPIYVLAGRGEICRGVEIRDNTIHAARVRLPEAGPYYKPTEKDSTMVGAPITLMNQTEPIPGVGLPDSGTEGILEDILVQGNRIVGGEGLGILVQGVSISRIAGNTITGIQRRAPFPGITWDGFEQRWDAANGSGIWISPGSEGNEIVGNVFDDIASAAVFLEGDSNRVVLQEAADAVRDLGTDNLVVVAGGDADSVRDWLASNVIRLNTVEPRSGLTDLQPMKTMVGDARIVALGEPTHGNREVFRLKHRMIEFLVTEMDFNVFALESPMAETFDLNDYVLTGTGDPAKALAGIRYWTWDTEEVLEVIEWIREYNADPANARKVTFYGFDVQDPERAARVTLEYLQRVEPALAEAVLPALGIFATPFTLPEYAGLRPIIPREGHPPAVRAVAEVVSSLDARKDEYIAATNAAEWTLARQHAQLLARYIEASSDDARNWGPVRDRAMAENVQWILEQEGDDAKIILWAHNSHVANASPQGFELMGSHLRRMVGSEMVIFGFLFNRGVFRAIDAGVPSEGMRNFTVGPAPEGTVEAMFTSAGLELAVVDLRRITPGGAVAAWFQQPRLTRHSGGGYSESDPERYLWEYTAPEAFDALVFIDSTTPVRHVNEADYDVLWVREQMLPVPVNLDFESGRRGEAPEGWLAWSKHRRLGFEMATTAERPYRGSYSAVVRRAPGQRYGEVAGSLSQRIDATPYRGKPIRFRAAARAEVADGGSFAFLRLAIDGRAPESIHDPAAPVFDSLDEYRVTSSEWRIYEIVADVPEDAVVISYGLFLAGDGSAWIDDVSVEVVDEASASAAPSGAEPDRHEED